MYFTEEGYKQIEINSHKDIVFKKDKRFKNVEDNGVPGPGKYRPEDAAKVLNDSQKGFHFT